MTNFAMHFKVFLLRAPSVSFLFRSQYITQYITLDREI